MGEPKYDEDTVNLGYLKKVISETSNEIEVRYKEVSRHYGAKPTPPYYKGDTWIDGDIVYTCINSRQIGLYEDGDWTTESGAKKEAEEKSKVFLTKPYNYRPGDMWILQSDDDHKAGKKGEILISNAGRKDYNEDDWINMLGYGNIISINEIVNNLNEAINQIGGIEEANVDGLIITFYQNTVPTEKSLGDLWYATENTEDYLKDTLYRYDGTNWSLIEDERIKEAFKEANEARIVSDGKIQSFYSDNEPSENVGTGDLWIDKTDDNRLYRYNGTKWVAVYDTRIHNLIVNTNTTSERVAEIQTDLGNITSKVSTIEEQVTATTGDIERIDKTITENTAKQEIKDNQILQTVTNQVTTAKQEAIDSANNSTDEKLQNYSTTSQMESKISQKASEINLKLEEKVDNDTLTGAELALRINQGGSEAKLNADRIILSAEDVLNLLAGNTINLTSKNIGINSNNFKVDKYGNVTISGIDKPEEGSGSSGSSLTIKSSDSSYTRFDAGQITGYRNNNPSIEIDMHFPYILMRYIDDEDITSTTFINSFNMTLEDYTYKLKTEIWPGSVKFLKNSGENNIEIKPESIIVYQGSNYLTEITANDIQTPEVYLGDNKFKVPEILHGNISITPSAINTPTAKAVIFEKSFTKAPNVTTGAYTGAPGTSCLGVGIQSVSTTSFNIYLTRKDTTTTRIDWIATN